MLNAFFYSDKNICIFCARLAEEGVMNDFEEIIQATYIGVIVAAFLYMTGRAPKAIELCKESLVLLNDKELEKEKQFANFLYEAIYKVIFEAYHHIRDIYTNAIAHGRKLLASKRECRKTAQEGILCINLATICKDQNKYSEAKELYERAISIMNKTGNRKDEAQACAEQELCFTFSVNLPNL